MIQLLIPSERHTLEILQLKWTRAAVLYCLFSLRSLGYKYKKHSFWSDIPQLRLEFQYRRIAVHMETTVGQPI